MKYALQNTQGLYLQGMGIGRNDYSFTTDINQALVFTDKEEAEKKRNVLMRYKTTVVVLE